MSNLHYKKDGSLDMRYSSSRAAMSSSSSYGGGGGGGGGGGRSSYGYSGGSSSGFSYGSSSIGSSSSSGLHYKKDGSLDMRYSSSKAAASSASFLSSGGGSSSSGYGGGGSSAGYSYGSSSNSSGLHYKKDGTLDMRYSSSKTASSSSYLGSASSYSTTSTLKSSSSPSSDLHYKKDGTLDMRYSSSKAVASGYGGSTSSSSIANSSRPSSDLHYKKDGTLDMRYKSSREAESRLNSAFAKVAISNSKTGIPSHIPLTKAGLPDMRFKAAKEWVSTEASNSGVPAWLPTKKDGSLDTSKAVTQAFLSKQLFSPYEQNCREQYYAKRLMDEEFEDIVTSFREQPNTCEAIQIPQCCLLENTQQLKSCMRDDSNMSRDDPLERMISSQVPEEIREIDYKSISSTFGDEEKAKIGSGSFGVVLKGKWEGKTVAVKRLHLPNLNKREKISFVKELKILALVGEHPNLVSLYGYCVDPPCLVMEFVELGSLSYLLHYCEDPKIEAAITDGRIKKKLICGVVAGMHQLHEVGVVHGDLKPANVLVDKSYCAKITDFGLASLRGKTSSSVVSTAFEEDGANVAAGTGAYMAPELLDSTSPSDFKADVYSFAILLNEIIQEEEPFSGQEANFHGRGPFGAANYAKQGKRPNIKKKTPSGLKELIQDCWNASPSKRPLFQEIFELVKLLDFPDSF